MDCFIKCFSNLFKYTMWHFIFFTLTHLVSHVLALRAFSVSFRSFFGKFSFVFRLVFEFTLDSSSWGGWWCKQSGSNRERHRAEKKVSLLIAKSINNKIKFKPQMKNLTLEGEVGWRHINCGDTYRWLVSNVNTWFTLNTSYFLKWGSTADQPRPFYIFYNFYVKKLSSLQLMMPKI